MNTASRWTIASAIFTATSCTTPPPPVAPRGATEVDAPFGRTWDAVVGAFADLNIPIHTLDRASGYVATEELSIPRELLQEARSWAQCGSGYGPPDHAVYNVLVRGDSSRSTVRVTVRWMNTQQACATTQVWEQCRESEIKSRAEGQVPAACRSAVSPGGRK